MNSKNAIKSVLSMLLVALVFTNCDVQDARVGTFEDAADKIPNFTMIPDADNVTVKVEKNSRDAYFNVNLSNIGENAMILDGDYLGWCAHWSAPIGTDGEVYDGVALYSTMDDRNWNKLNYLLNMRRSYMNSVDGASYKEIQAVIWTIIEFKEFDVAENQIFDDLNLEAFHEILDDVRQHGGSFELKPGMIQGVFADMSVHLTLSTSTQTVLIEKTDTAYGGDKRGPGAAWWYIFKSKDGETQKLRAGSKGTPIGTVTVSPLNGRCIVNFTYDEPGGGVQEGKKEPVKIQGYTAETLPSFRPPSGPFTTYKGDLVENISIPCYPYYAIHVDALYFERVKK